MALMHRLYRTAMVETKPGFRDSKLFTYIVEDGSGQRYLNWKYDGRLTADGGATLCYAWAYCESSLHAVIAVDPDCTALSPEFADEMAMNLWLDAPAPDTLGAQLETDGCSAAWKTVLTTPRELMRYLRKQHTFVSDLRRAKNTVAMELFKAQLDTRVSDIPAQVRTRIRDWMAAKGLDTTWIGGNTTVRQVLHYVIENVSWSTPGLGPVTL
jgi:hypothetical protein